MTGPESLSRILAALAPDIQRSTSFTTIGVMTPAANGLFRFQAANSATHGSVFVRPQLIPDLLRLPIDGSRQGILLDPDGGAVSPPFRFATIFGLKNFCAVPLPLEGGGLLFGASNDPEPVGANQVDSLSAFARQAASRAFDDEPADEKETRLARLDALAETLPVLSTALDVRTIFDHLSGIARRVLPHQVAIVGLPIDDGGRIR